MKNELVARAAGRGGRLKLHDDLRAPFPKRLARPQIDRHTGPAVVVDVEFDGGVGLGVRVGINSWLLSVADDGLTVHPKTGTVLAPHTVAFDVGAIQQPHRPEQVRLGVTNDARIKRRRRLHADVGQHLQEMVLQHVADDARLVVVAPAGLDAHGLRGGDLNMVDVPGVPEGREHAVGEPECQQILHRFLAEIMVDPVDLLLTPVIE